MLRKIRVFVKDVAKRDAETLIFAANELKRYLQSLTTKDIMLIEERDDEYASSFDGICLGLNLSDKLTPTTDPKSEDSILIDVTGEDGLITGVNPRAVLLAVYRYLREMGFFFLRPGKDGEIYPENLKTDRVYVCEKPKTKIRAVCIEGSNCFENTIDFVDWLPKIGMNSFHLQNFVPAMFYKRMYEINPNYHNKPIVIPESDIKGFANTLMREMDKRGLLLQNAGHGWNTAALDLPANTWFASDEEIPEDVRKHLAMLNGKRAFHRGIPMGTNLCYGNAETRKLLADYAVDYCKKNPTVSIIHFWLGDAGHNHCECPKCIGYTASDLYVMLLNEVDAALTANNIDVRLTVDVYCDTMWPPVTKTFNNPDRFILLFGPITRTFSKSYDPDDIGQVLEYVRNKSNMPKDMRDLLAHIKAWQEKTGSETILYDFHYMWDHYKVFGYWDSAVRINEDIKKFEALKFDAGFISCQEQRVFFPSAFGQHVMAETLWNTETEFEISASKALKAEFGANSEKVADFLKELTYLMNPKAVRREESMVGEDKAENFDKAIALADSFRLSVMDNVRTHTNNVQNISWKNLGIYCELVSLMCKCYAALSRQNFTPALVEAVKEFVFAHEWELRYVLDSYELLKVFLELVDYTDTGLDRCVIY